MIASLELTTVCNDCTMPCMKLDVYLKSHDLTDARFAALVGCDRTTVMRWRRGKSQPDWGALRAIIEATSGAVTPNDFISLAPHQESSNVRECPAKASTLAP